MSPTTGTRSRMTSRPTGRLMPGITTSLSSTFSIASTRWRTDCGSVPTDGKESRSSIRIASLVRRFFLQVGERVARVTVPGEILDPRRNERPAHRRSDRQEKLAPVNQRSRLDEEGIALRRNRSLACRVHQIIRILAANGDELASEVTREPGGGRRGCNFVDQREIRSR